MNDDLQKHLSFSVDSYLTQPTYQSYYPSLTAHPLVDLSFHSSPQPHFYELPLPFSPFLLSPLPPISAYQSPPPFSTFHS